MSGRPRLRSTTSTDDASGQPAAAPATPVAEHSSWRWALRLWGMALVAGVIGFVIAPNAWDLPVRLLTGWNAVVAVDLAVGLWVIVRSDPDRSRAFARETDPGNVGLLLTSVLVSVASVLSAVLVLAQPAPNEDTAHALLTIAQVFFAIFGGWAMLQIAFTFHYARLYYARGDQTPDLGFPEPPDDLDFAYFAFGIGVSFQVSDVPVTGRAMRRVVLVQSVLSFAFNAAILALMVNLLAGRI